MSSEPNNLNSRNKRTLLFALLFAVGMIGASFAAVPLYDLFCRMTGFGGTTQVATAAPGAVGERTIKVSFNTDVYQGLDWDFKVDRRNVDVKLGQEEPMVFHAKNLGSSPSVGVALYNVTPPKAGQYYNKIQCFCFENQTLTPGQTQDFPISFFLDPEWANDPDLQDVTEVTLSYTFFAAHTKALEDAKTKGYQ